MDAAGAGKLIERWYRSAHSEDGGGPIANGRAAPGPSGTTGVTGATGGRPLVEVVDLPGLAAELAELLHPEWEVRAVEGLAAVSASADAVVLDAPRTASVARARRAAPHAELVATFSGPAPGPVRDQALRAGVACCVAGAIGPVVARSLTYLRSSVAVATGARVASAPPGPAGPDRASGRPATTAR